MFIETEKNKIKINRYLSLSDFLLLVIFFTISSLIFFTCKKINLFFAIITSLTSFSLLSCCLIKVNGENIYKKIIIYISYIFRKIKKNKCTSSVVVNKNNIVCFKNKKINKYYLSYNIEGINIIAKTDSYISNLINNIHQFLKMINSTFYLIKTDTLFNWSEYNNTLCENYNDLHPSISSIQDNIYSKNINNIIYKYTILFELNTESECDDINNLISNYICNGFNLIKNKPLELINIIRNLLDPTSNELCESEIEFENNLIDKFIPERIIENDRYLKISNLFFNIDELVPTQNDFDISWLWKLIKTNSNLILSAKNILNNEFVTKIEKTLTNIKSNILVTPASNKGELNKLNAILNNHEELLRNISQNIDNVKKVNLYIINYASNERDLVEERKNNLWLAKTNGFKVISTKYKQFKLFKNIFYQENMTFINNYSWYLTCKNIALSYPFIKTNSLDQSGCFMGHDIINYNPVLIDVWKLNENRRNHNLIVLGSSGNGKTTAVKKIIEHNKLLNKNIIIIDPENEYIDLTSKLSGTIMNISSMNNNSLINPLQIFTSYYDSELDDIIDANETKIINHINLLENWISILYNKISLESKMIFKKYLMKLYDSDIFKVNRFDEISIELWPTMIDLFNLLKKDYKKNQDDYNYTWLLNIIESDFIEGQKLYKLFSNRSKLKNLKQYLSCFSINNIFESYTKEIVNSFFLLLMNYIINQIKANRIDNNSSTLLVIDEAHLFINNKNNIILNFLYHLTKRIRKYNSGIILISQNINDFISDDETIKQTTGIINNMQYSLIFNLQSNDINNIVKLYSNTNQINEKDIINISNFNKGECLFLNQGNDNILFKTLI